MLEPHPDSWSAFSVPAQPQSIAEAWDDSTSPVTEENIQTVDSADSAADSSKPAATNGQPEHISVITSQNKNTTNSLAIEINVQTEMLGWHVLVVIVISPEAIISIVRRLSVDVPDKCDDFDEDLDIEAVTVRYILYHLAENLKKIGDDDFLGPDMTSFSEFG
ncbi:hypothetical protein PG990_011747 [Apiospora arundinis]